MLGMKRRRHLMLGLMEALRQLQRDVHERRGPGNVLAVLLSEHRCPFLSGQGWQKHEDSIGHIPLALIKIASGDFEEEFQYWRWNE